MNVIALKLRGLVVDRKIIDWDINPEALKSLKLYGCAPEDFAILPPLAETLETFEADHWGFLPAMISVASSSTVRKRIRFLPVRASVSDFDLPENLLRWSSCLDILELSKFCLLPTEALVAFLNSNCAVRELRLPIASTQ
jgi:hypothetical protein